MPTTSRLAPGHVPALTMRELVVVALGAACAVALVGVDASVRGAVGIPRDDDWSYLRTIFDFASSGTFTLNGWVHMMFIGQAVPGAILIDLAGPSITALQVANALVAVVALVLTYAASRQLLATTPALFLVAVLTVNPVFAHLVVTAMTDLPVLALQAGCLLCGLVALRNETPNWPLTIGGLTCGMAAFTIREYGVVVLVAVAVVLLIRFGGVHRGRRFRGYLIGLTLLLILCAAAAIVLWAWRRDLPNDIVNVSLPLDQATLLLFQAAAVLGLMIVPVWCAVSWVGLRRLAAVTPVWVSLPAVLVGLAMVAFILVNGNQVLGNIIHPFGSTWTSVGDGIRAVPLGLFRMLQALGYASLVMLCAVVAAMGWLTVTRFRKHATAGSRTAFTARQWQLCLLVTVILALLGSYVVATGALGAPLIDRYFLLPAPLVGVVLLAVLGSWHESTWRRLQAGLSGLAVGACAVIGTAFVDASAQVDGARWRMAEALVAQGVDPAVIDAGDPWFRYHQKGPGRAGPDTSGRPWWVTFFPEARACWTIVLTSQQEPGSWGAERSGASIQTLLGEQGRLVVVAGPDSCSS